MGRPCRGTKGVGNVGLHAMRTRKFFTLEDNEEFIGVLRPSLWSLAPRSIAALILIAFPFTFWPSLLHWGVLVGGCFGVIIAGAGVAILRDLRRHYLENGIYLTSKRALDVFARRKNVRVVELRWNAIEKTFAERKGIRSWLGYGSMIMKGSEKEGFSLVITPLWKPELVATALAKV